MPFKPVILPTDALLFLLVAVSIVSAWYIRRQEHLRAPWRKVSHSRYGMCSLVVLTLFAAIGLLDSLHYRPKLEARQADGRANYAVEVRSVFDVLVDPLGRLPERTYSAPLSAYSYAKETVVRPDGTQAREFPRLKYGGAHLSDPARDLAPDVARRTLGALGLAVVLWIALTMLLAAGLSARHSENFATTLSAIIRGETPIPWRPMLLTAGPVIAVATILTVLSARYHVLGTDKVG